MQKKTGTVTRIVNNIVCHAFAILKARIVPFMHDVALIAIVAPLSCKNETRLTLFMDHNW